tara:strand:- start:4331 stop:7072 length:2742 start_codon:yes stop_codon:yes gene_type:complete
MSECVTNIDLNFSNGGGGHTATVTSIVGAQSAQTSEESLGEIVGDVGSKSSFSDSRIDSLMSRFVETEITTNADPTKVSKVRKYMDATSIKLNSYVVLVRGINAPPRGESEFEEKVPYFSEVKGTAVPSYGGVPPAKPDNKSPVIIAGQIYNMETRRLTDPDNTNVSLIYQGKDLKSNLSLAENSVSEQYRNNPDPSQYSLKFGYTLSEFKQILEEAGVEYEGLDPENGDDVLFEANGPLVGVVGSVASYFGFYHYIDPLDGKLKFINSALAAQLKVTDYTNTTDKSIISASFTKSGVTESIVNTYAGTAEKLNKSDMGTGGDRPEEEDVIRTYFRRVEIEQFDAFKAMKMGESEIGAFFSLFNQDQPPEIFDKFTYSLLALSQRNCKQNGQLPNFADNIYLRFQDDQGNITRPVVRLAGNVDYVEVDGKETCEIELIRQPLYLPTPYNLELWAWGPDEGDKGATQVIWAGEDAIIKSNEKNLARKADKGHQFQRYSEKGDEGEGESAANYFALVYEKSDAQIEWEAVNEDKKLMPMPKPSQSPLYEFLKIYFQIAGGVYVSHGYTKQRALKMSFGNSSNITVGGPFFKRHKIKDIPELSQLHNFFQILGIGENATIGQLADLTNGEAKTVHDYHFVAIRNLPRVGLREIGQVQQGINQRPFSSDSPANFGPLGTHVEIYDKPNSLNGVSRYIGGPLLNTNYRTQINGVHPVFGKYLADLIYKSIRTYKLTAQREYGDRSLVLTYTLHPEIVHPDVEDQGEPNEDDDLVSGGGNTPVRQEQINYADRFDHRFYDVVAAPSEGVTKPVLSSASGNTKEMKTLRDMKGDSQTSSGSNLSTSSRTIYGLKIPEFSPTTNSISITVGQGGIQTTIGESTVKILPPDQQFLLGLGVESSSGRKTNPRLAAHQRNHFGL